MNDLRSVRDAEIFKLLAERFTPNDDIASHMAYRMKDGTSYAPFRQEEASIVIHRGEKPSIKGSIRLYAPAGSEWQDKGFTVVPIFFNKNMAPDLIRALDARCAAQNIDTRDLSARLIVRIDNKQRNIFHTMLQSAITYRPRFIVEEKKQSQMSMTPFTGFALRYCNHGIGSIETGQRPKIFLGSRQIAEGPFDLALGQIINPDDLRGLLGGVLPSRDVLDIRVGTLHSALAAARVKTRYSLEQLREHFAAMLFESAPQQIVPIETVIEQQLPEAPTEEDWGDWGDEDED